MKQQKKVLHFISSYIRSYGFSPTYKEICAGCDIKSKSHTFSIVESLIDQGFLKKKKKRNTKRRLSAS